MTPPMSSRSVRSLDQQHGGAGVWKSNRRQISLTINPDLLEKVDALALEMGQSRAAIINLAVFRLLESERRLVHQHTKQE